jgi:hypothetical protein
MTFLGAVLIKRNSTTPGLVDLGVDVKIILKERNMRTWTGFN